MGDLSFVAKNLHNLPKIGKVTSKGGTHSNTWGVYCDLVTETASDVLKVYVGGCTNKCGIGARLSDHLQAKAVKILPLRHRGSLPQLVN
jgi:hypothetical protein